MTLGGAPPPAVSPARNERPWVVPRPPVLAGRLRAGTLGAATALLLLLL